MTKTSLRLENATVVVNQGTPEEKTILNNVSLTLNEGDFVTVLGSNGAGKSTLFNVIAGSLALTRGHIYLGDEDVTRLSETHKVFGTCVPGSKIRNGASYDSCRKFVVRGASWIVTTLEGTRIDQGKDG